MSHIQESMKFGLFGHKWLVYVSRRIRDMGAVVVMMVVVKDYQLFKLIELPGFWLVHVVPNIFACSLCGMPISVSSELNL